MAATREGHGETSVSRSYSSADLELDVPMPSDVSRAARTRARAGVITHASPRTADTTLSEDMSTVQGRMVAKTIMSRLGAREPHIGADGRMDLRWRYGERTRRR